MDVEVVCDFIKGRILPRRIRYYDVAQGSYQERWIKTIDYCWDQGDKLSYGVSLNGGDGVILSFFKDQDRWFLDCHL